MIALSHWCSALNALDDKRVYTLHELQLFLTEFGHPKIADHGIIHYLRNNYCKALAGKQTYLAPEQLAFLRRREQFPNYDVGRADVFSFGFVFMCFRNDSHLSLHFH